MYSSVFPTESQEIGNLVLGRYQGESILIGDNIVVTVVRISGNMARISVQATKDVKVIRGELAERFQKEKEKDDAENQ